MKVDLGIVLLQSLFQTMQGFEVRFLELGDPSLVDRLKGNGIEEVQLLSSVSHGSDEIRRFEERQVLRDTLARHVEMLAQLVQCLAVVFVQHVQESSSTWVGERLEEDVDVVGVFAHVHKGKQILAYYLGKWGLACQVSIVTCEASRRLSVSLPLSTQSGRPRRKERPDLSCLTRK